MHKALLAALLVAFNPHVQAQWQIQDAHTTADLRGIHSLGDGLAWASGSGGTVLRTEDNGAHWQRCTTPPGAEKLDFRGIQAFDKNTAIAMSSGKGDLSRVYKTTDACKTWTLVFSNPDPDGFWDALRFDKGADNNLIRRPGILLGDPIGGTFVIYVSTNQGDSWIGWPNGSSAKAASSSRGESSFAASNSALIVPGTDADFAFVTGGPKGARLFNLQYHDPFDTGSWRAFKLTSLPLVKGAHAGAFSVARRITSFGADLMIVGGDFTQPDLPSPSVLIPYRDPSWFGLRPQRVMKSSVPPAGYRSAVAYDSKSNTWITVGPNGTDISTDDGRNWRALKPDPKFNDTPDADGHWNALSLPFVVGPHGRVGLRDGTPATP